MDFTNRCQLETPVMEFIRTDPLKNQKSLHNPTQARQSRHPRGDISADMTRRNPPRAIRKSVSPGEEGQNEVEENRKCASAFLRPLDFPLHWFLITSKRKQKTAEFSLEVPGPGQGEGIEREKKVCGRRQWKNRTINQRRVFKHRTPQSALT